MPRDERPPFRKPGRFQKPSRGPRSGGRRSGGFRNGGKPDDDTTPEGVRLQKVMASAGVGSRRHCEELIAAGRVQINGGTARLGDRVPEGATVTVDGETLSVPRRTVYYFVNKPEGVVCTNYDQAGRTRVVDLVPHDDREHLFTVGRLDMSSEGLILVTNDGELANRLTHPKFGVEKTYLALVAGRPEPGMYQKLRQGVHLAEGVARCVSVHVKKELPQSTLLEIVLNEGKNREIRRILAKVGHKVLTLKRIALGGVTMRGLSVGEFRPVAPFELRELRESTSRRRPQRQARPVEEAELMAAARPLVDEAAEGDEAAGSARPRRFEGRGERRPPRGEKRGFGARPQSGQGARSGQGPRFGKPRPERTVLGGGDQGDGENAGRRPPRGKRLERRGEGAGSGRPPRFDKGPPTARFADADGGDEGESLGAHPAPPTTGRSSSKPPRAAERDGKKFRRKRRPTPMFPKRKKRD